MARKRRSDRNHVVYRITCLVTGERYIGITVVSGRAFQKSVKIRWHRHLYHALIEKREYPLQIAIREHGPSAFTHELLCVIRGKQEAHDYEKALIQAEMPELNVECTGRKIRPSVSIA
jgi:hypothetical protein